MLNSILTETLTIQTFFICMIASIIYGAVIAWVHSLNNQSSKGFVMTIAVLPVVVQMIIILVNGNLGTGVAVMGAFSLVRFRSIPGNAKEINSIFIAMAAGLAAGTGYVAIAGIFVIIICGLMLIYNNTKFGESKNKQVEKELKITIPEGLDYTGVFDDLFHQYTTKAELMNVKTSNMGSLFKLHYRINLKNTADEKTLIDEIRCRNGNLEINCGRVIVNNDEL